MDQPTWLCPFLLLTLYLSISGVISTTFNLVNKCNYTVWPATSSSGNASPLATTGFVLRTGESFNVTTPATWNGRFWGRTQCATDPTTGNFSCVTGDCGSGKVACNGRGSTPPATLVEFSTGASGGQDFYDVNLVDGYNLPVMVIPGGGSCSSVGCAADMNAVCPTELKVTEKGQVVACQGACGATNLPFYCCVGNHSTAKTCEPSVYALIFKQRCPQAYSYPFDDKTSTFTCSSSSHYDVVFCPASNNASRSVGDSLTAGNGTTRWLSPSEDFAFGFHQLPNELFLLAIWYDKIPNNTIIWSANGNNPIPKGSRLELNDTHGLVLKTPQGSVLWKSDLPSDGKVFNGLMNDDGNFQLLDRTFVALWESFSYPTDTLVPNQVLELNKSLSSRQGEFNFSRGRFKLRIQEDGNVVFNLVNLPSNYSFRPYYDTGTADAKNLTNVGQRLVFDKSGSLYVLKKSGERFLLTNKPNETFSSDKFYYKATINYDGVFIVEYCPKDPKNGQSWVIAKTIPEDICSDFAKLTNVEGVCGFNSVCILKDDKRPMCICPERYSLIDSSNMFGGCIPKNDDSLSPFSNQIVKKDLKTWIIVLSVLLGSSVFVIMVLVGARHFGSSDKKIKSIRTNRSVVDRNLRNFTFKEILEATSNFREELGRGSCSIVYKGLIEMTDVAVKKLDKLIQESDKEFQTEVNVIGQTHHRNLVRLLGYCNEGQHRILVYELMRNGTLASFLFTPLKPNWNQRFQIALGIAKGLVYLHEECSTQIIHCDIKPQNILLDDHYTARISDFGLAKLLLINQSHTETGIRGTRGYVAPDWFRSAPITTKVDTYSFGVLLLEIICCRKNVEKEFISEEKGILTDWTYDCYQSKRLDTLLEDYCEDVNGMENLEKFVKIAIWCTQEDPSLRPTMKMVLLMLEGIVEVASPPSPYLHGSVSCN